MPEAEHATAAEQPPKQPGSGEPSLSFGYQLFVLSLSVSALALTAALVVVDGETPTAELLQYADLSVCAVFLIDFVVTLVQAPNKARYFFTWGWLDVLSSIPAIDVARWGRAARVFRILRVLRAFKATRVLASLAVRYRARNAVLAGGLILLVTVFSCSIAVLHFEGDANGNIRTAPDALWWAVTTVTTVGYGDFYPVTWEGRLVASVLMFTGVGIFSALAGAMSLLFISPTVRHEDRELQRLQAEVAGLKALLTRREKDATAESECGRVRPGIAHEQVSVEPE